MVRKWIRWWEEEGSVKTKPRCGRPRATSPRIDALIVAAAEMHSMRTSAQHTEHLGLNCNPMTLRCRLHEARIHSHIPAYKGWLTPAHKKCRLGFALKHLPHEENYWRIVIFTDGKVFQSVAARVRHCWRRPNTYYQENHIHHRAMSGRVAVSFWGWMWAYGPGELVKIDGRFTGEKYIKILEEVFLPTVRAIAVSCSWCITVGP
ncbi:uncharacterized protein LOC135222533 [Macrobrachium nipponense]|uniref:uncharacterized protein LOC135222533 n=1 Tax=Macrobrachium nipponense TaxID=159736 RepID=UPI0030C7B480